MQNDPLPVESRVTNRERDVQQAQLNSIDASWFRQFADFESNAKTEADERMFAEVFLSSLANFKGYSNCRAISCCDGRSQAGDAVRGDWPAWPKALQRSKRGNGADPVARHFDGLADRRFQFVRVHRDPRIDDHIDLRDFAIRRKRKFGLRETADEIGDAVKALPQSDRFQMCRFTSMFSERFTQVRDDRQQKIIERE